MFCSNCGRANADGSAFCIQCGKPLSAAAPAAAPVAPFPAVATGPQLFYAGFWLRLVAYLIDMVIFLFVEFAFALVLIFSTGLIAVIRNLPRNPTPDEIFTGTLIFAIIVFGVGMLVMMWLYYAAMESSRYQGTLGKIVMGLIVTDMQYRPISFARASGRFFGRFITGLIPFAIGYIMAGFTAKKQALHDMIASCLVLRKT